jgi:hypothetical protein
MPEIPFYYSNVVGIVMSQNDITLDFGYRSPEQIREKSDSFDIKVRISMSPSHAKHMLVVLKGLIDNYEENIGEIPLEKDKKEKYNEMFTK